MCNCNNPEGFAKAMQNAAIVEKNTGKQQAVYHLNGTWYFGNVSDVEKKPICCYTLTSGKEVKVEKKALKAEKKETTKKKTTKKKNAVQKLQGTADSQL